MSIDYSVIIPAYNEEVLLPATLASVRESMLAIPELVGETIVTDNNSSDRTADIATAAGARVVYEEHQQIARARNAGAQIARGRYFIFLDADTLLNGPAAPCRLGGTTGRPMLWRRDHPASRLCRPCSGDRPATVGAYLQAAPLGRWLLRLLSARGLYRHRGF